MVQVKRVYEKPSKEDGKRILVDRVWPRGVSKEKAAIDEWLRDIAPSSELRKWFGHDPEKWDAFRDRYWKELQKKNSEMDELRNLLKQGPVTLVYGARDEQHNNAVALEEFLQKQGYLG